MENSKLNTYLHLQNTYLLDKSLSLQTTQAQGTAYLLEQSYKQNVELQNLKNEISTANASMKTILENQLKEIKYKHTQRFYKALFWYINNLVERANKINNSIIQYKIFIDFLNPHFQFCKQSVDELEDIKDKEFAFLCVSKFILLSETISQIKNAYFISSIKKLGDLVTSDNNKIFYKTIDEKIKQVREKIDKIKKDNLKKVNEQIINLETQQYKNYSIFNVYYLLMGIVLSTIGIMDANFALIIIGSILIIFSIYNIRAKSNKDIERLIIEKNRLIQTKESDELMQIQKYNTELEVLFNKKNEIKNEIKSNNEKILKQVEEDYPQFGIIITEIQQIWINFQQKWL